MRPRKVHFVTVKHTDVSYSKIKARIKKHYAVQGSMAFLHVELATDRSDFDSALSLRVQRLGDDYRVTVHNAVAVANEVQKRDNAEAAAATATSTSRSTRLPTPPM
jgi:hypothetical protein